MMRFKLVLFFVMTCVLNVAATDAPVSTKLIEQPLPVEFSREKWREIYLELANPEMGKRMTVINPPPAGSREAALIEFYQKNIEPTLLKVEYTIGKYYAYHLLIDTGLYNSVEERDGWKKSNVELLNFLSAHEADAVWQANVREYGRLATGLQGGFAADARLMAERLELEAYPSSHKAQAKELALTEQKITNIASALKTKDRSMIAVAEQNEVMDAFYNGKITFSEAGKKVEALGQEISANVGEEMIARAGNHLNRVAALRSELAKAKGFKNWADLRTAQQGESHAEGLKTTEDLLKFLYSLIDETDSAAKKVYQQAAARQGRTMESLRPSEMRLLLKPPEFLLYGYFQRKNTERDWREAMAASGFSEKITGRVMADLLPRENKTNGGFMAPMRMVANLDPVLDGTKLEEILPADDSPSWRLPVTAIVQSDTDDNIGSVRTRYHEGGHALDYATQKPELKDATAYGKIETHSTTMEKFLKDLEFLRHIAINEKGERPTDAQIDAFIKADSIDDLMSFRATVIQSIYDLELWNYDYSQKGAASLWTRGTELTTRLMERLRFVPIPKDLIVKTGKSFFSSQHFYSGNVRYYGYVLAAVAAEVSATRLLDILEETTGRRSLFQQPTIGPILSDYYRQSGKVLFPASIEAFTKKKFSAQEFARSMNARVEEALNSSAQVTGEQVSCELTLKDI